MCLSAILIIFTANASAFYFISSNSALYHHFKVIACTQAPPPTAITLWSGTLRITNIFKEIKWHLLMMQLIILSTPVKFLQQQEVSSILTAPIIKVRTRGISFVFTARRLCPHILTHRLHLMNLFITASLYWHLVDWRGVGCDAVWMQSNICTWWMAKSVSTVSWRTGRTLELEPQHSRQTGKKHHYVSLEKKMCEGAKGGISECPKKQHNSRWNNTDKCYEQSHLSAQPKYLGNLGRWIYVIMFSHYLPIQSDGITQSIQLLIFQTQIK